MERTTRLLHRFIGGVLLALLVALVLPVGDARADECTTECVEGRWDIINMECRTANPNGSCQHCQVACPGGGGGPDPENPTP